MKDLFEIESDTLKTGKPAVSISNKGKARPANR